MKMVLYLRDGNNILINTINIRKINFNVCKLCLRYCSMELFIIDYNKIPHQYSKSSALYVQWHYHNNNASVTQQTPNFGQTHDKLILSHKGQHKLVWNEICLFSKDLFCCYIWIFEVNLTPREEWKVIREVEL